MSQGIDYLIEQSNFGGESPFPVPDHPWSATLLENRLTAVLMMMMPWQEGKATTRHTPFKSINTVTWIVNA
jgi:hypothetical protein